jgi:hypothetical protein
MLDPRIRDYVFLPLTVLMTAVQLLRILGMKYMNEPKNALVEPASLSFKTLHKTKFECDADTSKEQPSSPIELKKVLAEGDEGQKREQQALARSTKIRKHSEFIPEDALKVRKSFFCRAKSGFFEQEVANKSMSMMGSPDMMNNMMKQNMSQVVYMVMFQVIGSIF